MFVSPHCWVLGRTRWTMDQGFDRFCIDDSVIDNPLAFKIKDHDHSTSRESLGRDDRAYLPQYRAEKRSQRCETGRLRAHISIGKYRRPCSKSWSVTVTVGTHLPVLILIFVLVFIIENEH